MCAKLGITLIHARPYTPQGKGKMERWYDTLYRGGQIIEVGSWSHTRRYFFNALASDPDRAKVAPAYMSALFKLERIGYATNQRKSPRALPRRPPTAPSETCARKRSGAKTGFLSAPKTPLAANTTFVSLIASCELHGLEPWCYLRDLFYLLPDWPKSRVLELAWPPGNLLKGSILRSDNHLTLAREIHGSAHRAIGKVFASGYGKRAEAVREFSACA